MLFIVFPLLELFFSRWIVVAVAKENLLKTPGIVSLANFQCIQMLPHPRLAPDWLSLSFLDYWPMSGLLLLCTELPENCIYLNQSELSNFLMYIIKDQTNYARMSVRNGPLMKKSPHPPTPPLAGLLALHATPLRFHREAIHTLMLTRHLEGYWTITSSLSQTCTWPTQLVSHVIRHTSIISREHNDYHLFWRWGTVIQPLVFRLTSLSKPHLLSNGRYS